jgi:DNA topoisomerase-1
LGKSLIIVESPAKAATIKKYLDNTYEVEASAGHIKDLPERTLGVDVDQGFAPHFEVVQGKRKIVDKLKKAAAAADTVYLAPDPDREGEAIAWHIFEEIEGVAPRIERVLFTEITRDAVRKALQYPRELDKLMYESQLARRILDRLVGYQISPLLWRKVQGGLSAGRVQSVAVRLVVDREREIEAFDPREYWVIDALVDRPGRDPQPFKASLRRFNDRKADVSSAAVSREVVDALRAAALSVAAVERKERRRPAQPPFITSTLQQEASRLLRFSPSHTMSVAQRLYEGVDLGDEGRVGLITYMRTDSVRLSADAVSSIRDLVAHRFGPDYLPNRAPTYKNKRSAQDAHEAIRPSSIGRAPADVKPFLGRDEFRLYQLIYNRTLACQMAPAVYDQTIVDIAAGPAELRATGSVLRFDGFLAATRADREAVREVEKPEPEAGEDEFANGGDLPGDLEAGQALRLVDLRSEQKFTEPPPRFSEATLVRELEERGIGRPSTYATIVGTIQSKAYVAKVDGRLRPSELGRIVNDLLVRHFPGIVDFDFTARMESELDEVEEGKKGRLDVLGGFHGAFSKALELAVSEMRSVKADALPAGIDCELCGKPLLIRFGKNGAFLGCSGYPDCKNTGEFERDDRGHVHRKAVADVGKCPECGNPLQVRSGRFGKFVACTTYPKCAFTKPLSRAEQCPAEGCTGHLVEKVSKKGKPFFACDRYPDCRFLTGLQPVAGPCPQCGAPTLFVRGFRGTRTRLCAREGCGWSAREARVAKSA